VSLGDSSCQANNTIAVGLWTRSPTTDQIEAPFTEHPNFNAFLAYLGQFGLFNTTYLAMYQMRECFEKDWDNLTLLRLNSNLRNAFEFISHLPTPADESRKRLRSSMVTAASMWILINGSNLFTEMVQSPKELYNEGMEPVQFSAGGRYKGPLLGMPRWVFWRAGFEVAARGEGVDEKCAELAGNAAITMRCFEQMMLHP
jgi:hypothetical protein